MARFQPILVHFWPIFVEEGQFWFFKSKLSRFRHNFGPFSTNFCGRRPILISNLNFLAHFFQFQPFWFDFDPFLSSNKNQRRFVCRRRVCWISSSHAWVKLRVDFIFVLASHIISYNLNNGMRVCYNFVRNTNVEHFIGSLWFAMKCFLLN